MCQFLIQNGADINCVDIESRSVLQMAAWQGHTSIIQLLCECGVGVNSMCSQVMMTMMLIGLLTTLS